MSAVPFEQPTAGDFAKVDGARRRASARAAVAVVLAGRLAAPASATGARCSRSCIVDRARAVHDRRALAVARRPGRAGRRPDQPRARRCPATAAIVEPYRAVGRRHASKRCRPPARRCRRTLRLAEPATTQAVRLVWEPAVDAAGYHVYRNIYDPEPDRALGLPLAEILDPHQRQLRGPLRSRSRGATGTRSSRSTRRRRGGGLRRPRRRRRARRQRRRSRRARLGRRRRSPRASATQLDAAVPPARHRLPGPRHARAAHVRRARVAVHRRRRAAPVRRCSASSTAAPRASPADASIRC